MLGWLFCTLSKALEEGKSHRDCTATATGQHIPRQAPPGLSTSSTVSLTHTSPANHLFNLPHLQHNHTVCLFWVPAELYLSPVPDPHFSLAVLGAHTREGMVSSSCCVCRKRGSSCSEAWPHHTTVSRPFPAAPVRAGALPGTSPYLPAATYQLSAHTMCF